MKKILILIIVIAVGAFIYMRSFPGAAKNMNTYTGSSVRLTFNYPEGYRVTERPASVTLMTEEDYQSVQSGKREGGEGPAVIVISQYENPAKLGPQEWAEEFPQLSNSNLLMGEKAAIKVAGLEGIRYKADGLYPSHNIVFADGERIYHLNGQYLDQDSRLYRDFETIVNSIKTR